MHVCNSEFERNASGLLTELYNSNPDMSTNLVTQPLETWKRSSIFKLAEDMDSMAVDMDSVQFTTHDCVQARVDEIWRGKLSTNTPVWLVGQRCLSFIINSKLISAFQHIGLRISVKKLDVSVNINSIVA